MSRIIFLNRYYDPDHSATAQLLTDLAVALADGGAAVTVVTGRQCYDEPGARLPARETLDGVEVYRIATTRFGRARLPGRALDYLSFYLSAAVALLRLVKAGDRVVFKTDPPLLSAFLWPAVRLKKGKYINWLQDIFPEVARALGAVPRLVAALLRALRNVALRRAETNIAIGERMAQRLAAEGVERSRIRVIANWCDTRAITPTDRAANPLLKQWDLDGKFVVGYSGNLGRAHPSGAIAEAALALAGEADIVFLLIGGGFGMERLRERLRGRANNVQFHPYQARSLLAHSLSAPNVHLVVLDPSLEGLIVPSKFYGVAAAGRGCLFLGADDGEIGRIVAAADCGRVIAPDDGRSLASAILELRDAPDLAAGWGARARRLAEERFDREIAFSQWRDALR